MLFPTADFAVFFLVVFLLNWLIRSHPTAWKIAMLSASYFFYGYWDWRFVFLLIASSIVNHTAVLGIHGTANARQRRFLLTVAVLFNLGTIAFFKYAGFLVEQVFWLAQHVHLAGRLEFWYGLLDRAGRIILPVGISFFTFQALSYVADVYRNRMKPADSLLDFALYLAFFPQLVAGPIVRAIQLVGQLARPRWPERIDLGRAGILILGGLFKKIVIANALAEHIVDPVFARPELYGAVDTLFAVYGYAVQIYCDFSAYSDIAIGLCLLMGFHIPLNFDAPYLADSIQTFWRRWHISLSFFLRDYLYIPLGGSRMPRESLVYRNLFITFLLGGLWHGAGWTFIAWGALHGAYLSAERVIRPWAERRGLLSGTVSAIVQRVIVWHLVCLSWLFFRGQSFADAIEMLRAMTRWSAPVELFNGAVLTVIVVGYCTQLLDGERCEKGWDAFAKWHPILQGLAAAVALTVVLALGPKGVAPFIYFQF